MKDIYEELENIDDKLWELELRTNEGFLKEKLFEISFKINYLLLKIEERRFLK